MGHLAVKHVLGELPDGETCDVLFVGESPGFSEDILGRPFIGRSGRKLREWIEQAGGDGLAIAFNNTVACKGQDERRSKTVRPPERFEVEACQPRIAEVVEILNPRAIVFCGSVATDSLRELLFEMHFDGLQWNMPHPAWVLRSRDEAQETRYIQRLKDLFDRLRGERNWPRFDARRQPAA